MTPLSLCGSGLVWAPPVWSLPVGCGQRLGATACPREALISPRHSLAADTQGRELGQPWGEPALDSRGGAVLPAEVISRSHLHPTRLLASARTLMDKTSCQCLSPSLHPEVGAGSRGVAGHPWAEGQCQSRLRSPRARQVLAGPVIMGGFLAEGWGWKPLCWPGSQDSWVLRHPTGQGSCHLGHSVPQLLHQALAHSWH